MATKEPIDRKYTIHAVNPCSGGVHTEDDSVLFLAKDKALPAALQAYSDECVRLGVGDAHLESISLLMQRVDQYQATTEVKVPDTDLPCEIDRCLNGVSDVHPQLQTYLTLADIHDVIVSEDYEFKDSLTICILTLKNGAKVIGENYGSIDPERQDFTLGQNSAREKALEKVWELEGYLLRQRLMVQSGLNT